MMGYEPPAESTPLLEGSTVSASSVDEPVVVRAATGTHTHTVILLHGMYCRSDDWDGVAPAFEELGIDGSGVKYVLPESPTMTINWPAPWGDEDDVCSWYNYFTNCDFQFKYDTIDQKQMDAQAQRIVKIIAEEAGRLGGDYSRIILGGGSQGGTVAIHALMRCPKPIGLMVLTRTLMMENVTTPNPAVKATPMKVFVMGNDDNFLVPLQRQSYGKLRAAGFDVEWHVEPGLVHADDSANEARYFAKWIGENCLGCSKVDESLLVPDVPGWRDLFMKRVNYYWRRVVKLIKTTLDDCGLLPKPTTTGKERQRQQTKAT